MDGVVIVLTLALGVLLATFAVVILYCVVGGIRRYRWARFNYLERRALRDFGRRSEDVLAMLDTYWGARDIPMPLLKAMWSSLAACLDITPDLMRPTDELSNIIMTTDEYGPDTYDLVSWIANYCPQPWEVLADLVQKKGDSYTVADLLNEVIARMPQYAAHKRRQT